MSVRSAAEARIALAAGAHIIDIKEPARGPLGMADPDTIHEICTLAASVPTSAALGDLRTGRFSDQFPPTTYVKLALAHAPRNWSTHLSRLRLSAPLIPVAYADHARVHAPPPRDVLDFAIQHQTPGFLIDTAVKDGGNLFDHIDPQPLIAAARAANLTIALAGSLRGESFMRAVNLEPDIVGVRGAACAHHDRTACIDAARIKALLENLSAQPARSPVTQP